MKTYKKTLFVSLLVLGGAMFSVGAFAQAAGPQSGAPQWKHSGAHRQGPMKVEEKILAQLNLTKGQKTQIQALHKTMVADMKSFRETHKGDRKAMRAETQKDMKAYRSGLANILTKEQMAKYQSLWKAEMAKMKANRQNKGTKTGTAPA